jgi:hypothetical protein
MLNSGIFTQPLTEGRRPTGQRQGCRYLFGIGTRQSAVTVWTQVESTFDPHSLVQ